MGVHGSGMARIAAVIGVIVHMAIVAVVPTRTVDIVMISVVIGHGTGVACEVVIRRHGPCECGTSVMSAESKCLSSAVDVTAVDQVDAFEVDGHINFISSVGIPAVEPDFEERRADLLCPDFVNQAVGGQLVFIAAVNHNLVLIVEHRDCAGSLSVGEIENVVSSCAQCCNYQGEC